MWQTSLLFLWIFQGSEKNEYFFTVRDGRDKAFFTADLFGVSLFFFFYWNFSSFQASVFRREK